MFYGKHPCCCTEWVLECSSMRRWDGELHATAVKRWKAPDSGSDSASFPLHSQTSVRESFKNTLKMHNFLFTMLKAGRMGITIIFSIIKKRQFVALETGKNGFVHPVHKEPFCYTGNTPTDYIIPFFFLFLLIMILWFWPFLSKWCFSYIHSWLKMIRKAN